MVEDDADVRGALAALLESVGHSVVEAEHGREALEYLRSENLFCLIVLDLFMPEMDGWGLRTEQLRDPRLATIPVVVISADSVAAKKAVSNGVVATFTKPIEFDKLLRIVEQYC